MAIDIVMNFAELHDIEAMLVAELKGRKMSRIPKNNEYKYRTIRRHQSGLILDEVWGANVEDSSSNEYANKSELEYAMKLTGLIEVFNKNLRFHATRKDMIRLLECQKNEVG